MPAVYVLKVRTGGKWRTEAICENRKLAMQALHRYRRGLPLQVIAHDDWKIMRF